MTVRAGRKQAKRKPAASRGRWRPGESGNPAGRPPGTGEVAQLRAAIAEHVPAIIDAMVRKAVDGDAAAARLLLERTVAPWKAAEPAAPIELPDGTLTEQGRAVLAARLSSRWRLPQGRQWGSPSAAFNRANGNAFRQAQQKRKARRRQRANVTYRSPHAPKKAHQHAASSGLLMKWPRPGVSTSQVVRGRPG